MIHHGDRFTARLAPIGSAVVMLLAGASAAEAGVITQSFTSAWQTGSRSLDVALNPFDPSGAGGELLSVTFELQGIAYTQLTTSEPFTGSVPLRMVQGFSGLVEFGDGADVASVLTKGTLQEFSILQSSSWFSSPVMVGAVSVAPSVFTPGDGTFDRFTGEGPIGLHLVLGGGTQLLKPTPGTIGALTGTEWTLNVTYEFIPAPGGVALAGVVMLMAPRRRR